MEYFVPSAPGGRNPAPAPVPVNPSTIPGGRPASFPPAPSDWKTRPMPPVTPPEPLPPVCGPEPMPMPMPYNKESGPEPMGGAVPPEGSYAPYEEPSWLPEENYRPDTDGAATPKLGGMTPPPAIPVFRPGYGPDTGGSPSREEAMPTPYREPMPAMSYDDPGAPTSYYAADFLRGQAGRLVRIESLAGSTLTERVGRILRVGADYILLQSVEGHNVVCDLDAVRFATIVQEY